MAVIQVEVIRYQDPQSENVRVTGLVAGELYHSTVKGTVWRAAPSDAARAQLAADALFATYKAFTASTVPGWRRIFTYQDTGPQSGG